MKDAALVQTKAFPAAAANNSTTAFDLGPVSNPGHIAPENVEIEIAWPALAALADSKNVVFKVQDSADNSTFADLGLTKTITGAGGAGVAAGSVRFRLPQGTRRYLRVNQAEDSAGGDITASSSTVSLICH